MVIVEKQAKGKGGDARRYVRSLARYMETAKQGVLAGEYGLTLARYISADKRAERGATAERVLATGAYMGGQAVAWNVALIELDRRMSKRSARSRKPGRHLVGSVHVDEDISPQGCDDAASILADELGCEEGIVLWALHGDTNNRHLHFLILTLDEYGAATPFGRDGRSHEAMQRAIARIEHRHDLAPEPGARYEVRDGQVLPLKLTPKPEKVRAPIGMAMLQWEAETGIESFTRYAQEVLAPHLDTAASWDEAQSALAPLGARVVKVGSGGEIRSGDGHHKVKLSNVDRKLTWGKLIDRWGEWPEPTIEPASYEPRILDGERATNWIAHDQEREQLHAAVQARIDQLRAERKMVLDRAARDHAQRRSELANLRGDPADLARLRQGLQTVQRRQLDLIDAEYRDRIAALKELRTEIDETDSLAGIALDDVATFERSLSIDWKCRPAHPVVPPGFHTELVGQAVHYWRDDRSDRRPAFVERGNRIWINDSSDHCLRAALIVAQARYGVVAAHGDAAFVAQMQRLGREIGVDVQDGATPDVPLVRERSPRVRHRRDAVRRWQEAGAGHQPAAREAAPPTSGDDHRADRSMPMRRHASIHPMSEQERRTIMARVARLLADDDWDPGDYRRVDRGDQRRGRDRGRDEVKDAPKRQSSAASHQVPSEGAGRGR